MEEIKTTYTNTDKKDMTSKSRIPVTNTLFIKKKFLCLFFIYLYYHYYSILLNCGSW